MLFSTWDIILERKIMKIDKSIIVFAPHPDDEVIACGGTIIQKIQEGYDVNIVFMTDGSHSHSAVLNIFTNPTPSELRKIRKEEAINASKVLGVSKEKISFIDAEDTFLKESINMASDKIENILKSFNNLEQIYLPHQEELHQDHSLTNVIVTNVLKKLNLNIEIFKYIVWDEKTEKEFDFSLRSTVNKSIEQTKRKEKEIVIDISDVLEQKIQALKEHKSQVELISLSQTKPVLPILMFERLRKKKYEKFYI